MARFRETTDIRPIQQLQVDTSSLTARLDQFAQQKATEGAQRIAQQQFEAGKAAFTPGEDPEFKKERFFGKIPAKAYNEGLRASYIASLDRDNREEIARIVAENPNNLSVFNDQIETYRKATLANVDPTARQVVQDSLDALISPNRIKVQNNEIAQTHQENAREVSTHIEAATNDALGFARDGDNESAATSALVAFAGVEAAIQAGFIDEEQGKTQRRDIEKGITEESFLGKLTRAFDEEGETEAFTSLDELSKKRPKGFSPEEWDTFIGRSQKELNRKSARLERDSVANAKRAKIELEMGAIEARIAGDDAQIINPKVADQYYQERILPNIENAPPEVQQAQTAEYIDRLKLIPDTVVKQVTNAANSNNPDLLSNAAQLIDRIDEIPGVVNKIPVDQQAYIQTVADLMQNMEPKEAVQLARQITDPKDKSRIEAVEGQLKEQLKDDPNVYLDRSEGAFRKLFVFSDPVPDEVSAHRMAKEYGDIYEAFRKAGSSEADSFSKADKTIKRTWGVSTALGEPTIMKYPLDDYYSIDGDAAWVQGQLAADVREEAFGLEIDDVFLMANDQTARTAAIGQPSYAVKILVDGVFFTLSDNWMPDMGIEIEKRKTENVEEALKRRKSRQGAGIEAADFLRQDLRSL